MKLPNIKIIIILTILAVSSFLLFKWKQDSATDPSSTPDNSTSAQSDKPQIVFTKPDPLEQTIISASETIEITFNKPLENVGEFKVKIEPKIEFKLELTQDRKTAKITPTQPLTLGQEYTLSIGSETKFDGVGRWGEEKIFHFKTIKYRGV